MRLNPATLCGTAVQRWAGAAQLRPPSGALLRPRPCPPLRLIYGRKQPLPALAPQQQEGYYGQRQRQSPSCSAARSTSAADSSAGDGGAEGQAERLTPPAAAAAAGAPDPRSEALPAATTASAAAATGAGAAGATASAARAKPAKKEGLAAVVAPFNDPRANAKLLALCLAQALSSVGTVVHETYLPLFFHEVLHFNNTKIGNLQATCQLMAKASGSVSGTLADIFSPARMLLAGTAMSAVAKPLFALGAAAHAVLGGGGWLASIIGAQVFDHASKGVREAPTKVLIGQLAERAGESPAAAFSLRQSLMTIGMLAGAAAASLAFNLSGQNFVWVFLVASGPSAAALVLVAAFFGGEMRRRKQLRRSMRRRREGGGGAEGASSGSSEGSGIWTSGSWTSSTGSGASGSSLTSADLVGYSNGGGGSGSGAVAEPALSQAGEAGLVSQLGPGPAASTSAAASAASAGGSLIGSSGASGSSSESNGTGTGLSSSSSGAGRRRDRMGLGGKVQVMLGGLGPAYWQALAVVSLLYFARFDMSFVTLRARLFMDRSVLAIPSSLAMVLTASLAPYFGLRAKASAAARNRVLLAGISALLAGDLCMAFIHNKWGVIAGSLCIGLHMAMTHGVSLGMLSSYIPSSNYPGTAWSFTDLVFAVVLAHSNMLAGRLSDYTLARGLGNVGCFLGGTVACALSMAALAGFSAWGHLGCDELL